MGTLTCLTDIYSNKITINHMDLFFSFSFHPFTWIFFNSLTVAKWWKKIGVLNFQVKKIYTMLLFFFIQSRRKSIFRVSINGNDSGALLFLIRSIPSCEIKINILWIKNYQFFRIYWSKEFILLNNLEANLFSLFFKNLFIFSI